MKFCDVDEKIIRFLIEQIQAADRVGLIGWEKFEKYCLEFGMIDPPNMLTVPDPVILRCIKEARRRAVYVNGLNISDRSQ